MSAYASTTTHGLPVRLDPLIGRREELSLIRRLVQTSARSVTITGAAGVGKSRVAIAAAESLRRSASGVWYVDVRGNGGQLAAAVAHELKVDPGDDALASVIAAIGESDSVLLLDDVDEAVAETTAFVGALLTSCPAVRLIVTGREPIASPGNALVALGPLGHRDLTASSDSVRLFIDRAASGDARFAIDETTLPQVIRICEATRGVPLAIELAAAQLQFMDVRTLAKRMDRQLRTLEPSGSAYRSLRAAVEDSWVRCSPLQRRVWTDLSVLAPGWDLELGEAMASLSVPEPDSAMATVKQLIQRSIVHRRRLEGGVRYELLPALREFGDEQLENRQEAQRHFVACMIQRLHAAEDDWFSARQAEILRRLRGDIPNIRRAVRTAAALGDPDRSVELVVTGWRQAFQIHGSEDELTTWLAMALGTGTPSPRWAALGHALRAAIFGRTGKPGLAAAELERAAAARDLVVSGDDAAARGCDTAVRSAAETLEPDDGEASRALRRLIDELGEDAYRFGPTNIPQRLAARLYAHGDGAAADAIADTIVERAVVAGDRFERSFLLTTRATASAAAGDYTTAETTAREALVLKRGLGNGLGVAQALELLADVARERSDPVRSARLLGAAAARWREAGAIRGNYPPYFYDRDTTERAVRYRLGDAGFDRAFAYGMALSESESIEFALHRLVEAHARAGVPSAIAGASLLTPRETQVATLVADGASNKEMARRLFVSIRTVETHVQNALVKLGLRSRTELALWYRERSAKR